MVTHSLLEDVSTEGSVFMEGELSFTGLPGLGIKMKEIL